MVAAWPVTAPGTATSAVQSQELGDASSADEDAAALDDFIARVRARAEELGIFRSDDEILDRLQQRLEA
jgi:hypothetical protein